MSGSFLSELKRRNVLRVAMAYAAVAWLLVQIAETVMPLYGFSEDAIRTIVTVLAVGFVPALLLAWVFEWTPEGIQKEDDVRAGTPRDTRWLDRGIIVTLLIAVTYFAIDKWLLQPEPTHYGDKSIAVLPFDNLSDDPQQDYFGLGIAEEMLNLLALIPELRVISRTSSFELADDGLDIPEIAERLDVGHVLEGSVRRAGDKLRITAQLIEGATDSHIWSDTWDRELTDVFAVQDEIADEVVRRLEVIIAGEMPRSERTDPLAWDLVLQSREAFRGAADDDRVRALELAEQALALDPEYIPALIQVNVLAWDLSTMQGYDVERLSRLERETFNRAVELAPDHPQVLARRAWDQFEIHHDWHEAARHAERAVAAAPGDTIVLGWAAAVAQLLGRYEVANRLRQRIMEVDPINIYAAYTLVRQSYVSGDLDAAEKWFEIFQDLGGAGGYLTMTNVYLQRGEPEEALALAEQVAEEDGGNVHRAMALYSLGREDEALAMLDAQVDAVGPDDFGLYRLNAHQVGKAAAWMGQVDMAFEALEIEYGHNDYRHFFVAWNDPVYKSLHDDPRWQELLAKVNLTEAQRNAIEYDPQLPD